MRTTTRYIGIPAPLVIAWKRSNICGKSTMGTIRLPPDFKEFLKLLNSADVKYLLVGGYAVGYYGYPRTTGDMDIWLAVDPANAQRIVQVLHQFGFRSDEVTESLFQQPDKIIRMGVPPVRIELLTGISGVAFDRCYERRQSDELDGVVVNFISLADLKVNKQAAGRTKDLNDLEHLDDQGSSSNS